MTFTLHAPDGSPLAGDALFDQNMRARADEVGGYVVDSSTGERVYEATTTGLPAPEREEAERIEAERALAEFEESEASA